MVETKCKECALLPPPAAQAAAKAVEDKKTLADKEFIDFLKKREK